MNKEQTLESIQNARKAHEAQMEKIELVIDGKVVKNPTATLKTECEFGKWLYENEAHLEHVLGQFFYENLEKSHAQWHFEYVRIFEIFFNKEQKKGFFSKIFNTNQVDPLELDKAKLYYSELQETTNGLLKDLGVCERRVSALPESKFD